MNSKKEELQERTTNFALRVVRLFRSLPTCAEARVVGHRLLRSGTSVAANYRAACKGRSRADFISKLGIVEEEADETLFWLEFLVKSGIVRPKRMCDLIDEARQLSAIFGASRRTALETNRKLEIGNRKSRGKNSHD
jgi:four helix bundle protein